MSHLWSSGSGVTLLLTSPVYDEEIKLHQGCDLFGLEAGAKPHMTLTLHHLFFQGHNDPVQSAESHRSYTITAIPLTLSWSLLNQGHLNIATIALATL